MQVNEFQQAKIDKLLKFLYTSYYRAKYPRHQINHRDMTAIRIHTQSCRQGWLISPEYEYHRKWYLFQFGERPFILIVRLIGIGSFKSSKSIDKKEKVKRLLAKWFKEWQKEAGLRLRMQYEPDRNVSEEEEEEE